MFEDQFITNGTLKEFCEFELNKNFYDYYHQELKRYFDVEIDLVSFFKDLYSDVSVFYFNYLDLPHDVDKYLKNRYGNEAINKENAISIELRFTLFNYMATVLTTQYKIGDYGKIESLEFEEIPPVYDSFWGFQRNRNQIFLQLLKSKGSGTSEDVILDEFMQDFFKRVIDGVDQVRIKKYVLGLTSKQSGAGYEPLEVDFSNSSAAAKIAMLHELGVLDFLRKKLPFRTSESSLAKALSIVTGEKQGTLQPMFNAISNDRQKNNPLSSKNLTKAREILINIGFNEKYTN